MLVKGPGMGLVGGSLIVRSDARMVQADPKMEAQLRCEVCNYPRS